MKGLATLIRFKKWNLDEKRRALAELERLERNLRTELSDLADELQSEQVAAQSSLESGFAYADFARSVRLRRDRIDESLASIEKQAEAARDEVAEAFEELKRYELTQAGRERDARAQAERREQQTLDEVAQDAYRRRR